jgi:hypothetical protein
MPQALKLRPQRSPAQATIDRLRSQQAYLHDCNGCDLDVGRESPGRRSLQQTWI